MTDDVDERLAELAGAMLLREQPVAVLEQSLLVGDVLAGADHPDRLCRSRHGRRAPRRASSARSRRARRSGSRARTSRFPRSRPRSRSRTHARSSGWMRLEVGGERRGRVARAPGRAAGRSPRTRPARRSRCPIPRSRSRMPPASSRAWRRGPRPPRPGRPPRRAHRRARPVPRGVRRSARRSPLTTRRNRIWPELGPAALSSGAREDQ